MKKANEIVRDFQKEWKNITAKTKERKILIVRKDPFELWEIRKRSLNPQGLNKLVIGGLKMPWARIFYDRWFPIKAKTLDDHQVILYDLVLEKDGENLYINPRPIIKETGEDTKDLKDVQWQG